jgi:hypothetical protein
MEERMAALETRMATLEAGKATKKVEKKGKKVKAVLSLSPSDDMGRLNPADISEDRCQARKLNDGVENYLPGYSRHVYREVQCSQPKKVGDLCTNCSKAFEKATELGDEYRWAKSGHGKWACRITEDPHPTCHMLGTEWAETSVKKTGADESVKGADDASSDSGSSEEMAVAEVKVEVKAKAPKADAEAKKTAAAEKKAEAAAKKVEAAKAKAEKVAAKEAEKAEKKAVADAAKAAKAAKTAKAAKPEKAEKAEKAEKPKKEVKKGKKDVMPAKAADEEVKETYEPMMWDSELMLKKANGDCYYTDEATNTLPAKYAGHMTEDGVLDADIPEQKEAESDSE